MNARHALSRLAALALPAVITGLLASPAAAHDLTLEIVTPAKGGAVLSALYDADGTWLNEAQAVRRERQPVQGRTVIVYRDLPPGRYAISAFQDGNDNGRLDRNVVGLPLEPYGFSRDARGMMGPPSFADAVVDLQGDLRLTVQLR